MEPFSRKANVLGLEVAILLAYRARKKKSLTVAGAATAFVVGYLLVASGLRGFNLLVFYQIATKATKFKHDLKAKIDGTITSKGSIERGPSQVLACSILAVILSLIHVVYCGKEQAVNFLNNQLASSLTCGIIAHHATCLADTLASELGILAKSPPRLVTKPWKIVPPGTNGGITFTGLFYSALGGLMIGVSTIVVDSISGISSAKLAIILFSTCCGLIGSLIDSILGATVQESHWDPDTKLVYQSNDERPTTTKAVAGLNILSNEQVNLFSVAITTWLGGWVIGPLFFD